MIEVPIVCLTALLGLLLSKETIRSELCAGVVLGVGLLCKQTFIIAVVPLLCWPMSRRRLFIFAGAALVAGPWYSSQIAAQQAYLGQSVAGVSAELWAQLVTPALTLSWEVLGPCVALGLMVAFLRRKALKREGVWLLLALLIFVLIPKKYPRLLLGILPYVAVILSRELVSWNRWQREGLIAASAGWLVIGSLVSLPPNPLRKATDDRCPQEWLRPVGGDLGLRTVAAWARELPEGAIVVEEEGIPCSVQTTHPFSYHVEIFLRRQGEEREVIALSSGEESPKDAVLRVFWRPSGVSQEP